MGSVNKVILVGNLGRDAELRYTPGGAAVAKFSMATTEVWNDKAGQRQERTEWHNIDLWGKTGRIADRVPDQGQAGLRRGPPADRRVHRQGRHQAQEHRRSAATAWSARRRRRRAWRVDGSRRRQRRATRPAAAERVRAADRRRYSVLGVGNGGWAGKISYPAMADGAQARLRRRIYGYGPQRFRRRRQLCARSSGEAD